ncbi:unnamed protein product [Prunus brigantina]
MILPVTIVIAQLNPSCIFLGTARRLLMFGMLCFVLVLILISSIWIDFHPWLRSNLLSKAMWGDHEPWNLVFVFTCWVLWKWRNNHIFNIDDEVRYEPEKIIVAVVNEWYTSSQVMDTKASKIPLLLAWEAPELG